MEVEEFLKEAAVMKEIKHPNLVQLLGEEACLNLGLLKGPCLPTFLLPGAASVSPKWKVEVQIYFSKWLSS